MASVRERDQAGAYRALQVRQQGYETRTYVARTKRDLPQARADARQYAADLERRRAMGEHYQARPNTLGAELDGLIQRRRSMGRAASAIKRNECTAKHLGPLRDRLVRELTRHECEDLLLELADSHPREAQLATTLLKAALKAARERGQVVNPAILGIVPPSHEAREPRILTLAELDVFCSWLPPAYARLVRVAAVTGMRRGELLGLEDTNVHLDEGRVWVRRGKTKSARRFVDLPGEAVQAIREQLIARPRGAVLVWPNGAGRALNPDNVMHRHFRPAAVAGGFGRMVDGHYEGLTFHDLRHGAISLMAVAGWRPEHIARQVGHNDGGVLILRRYRHLFESEARPMVAALDALLRGDDRQAKEA